MADRRITELSAVSAIDVEVDLLPIVSGGTTKKITAKSFAENIQFLSYESTALKTLSANWQNTYTTVNETSSTWQDTTTVVQSNSAQWATVDFTDVTYVDVLSGLNEMLRLTIGGVTRYIRLFDVGSELFLFSTEDASDNIVTEDNNFQLLFD